MKDKIGKVFPILLVIAIIIKAVLLFTNNTDTDTTSLLLLAGYEELVIYAAIPTILFYIDRNKKNSPLGLIGYLLVAVYMIVAIISIIKLQNAETIAAYKSLSNMIKAESVIKHLITFIEYCCILNIFSEETDSAVSKTARGFGYLAALVYCILSIVLVFKTISYNDPQTLNYITTLSQNIYVLCIVTMVGFQYGNLLVEGEAHSLATENPLPNTPQPSQTATGSGVPKFRNPALEEQEARIAAHNAEKAAQQQLAQQQATQQQPVQQPMQPPQVTMQQGPPPIINGQPVTTQSTPQQPNQQ